MIKQDESQVNSDILLVSEYFISFTHNVNEIDKTSYLSHVHDCCYMDLINNVMQTIIVGFTGQCLDSNYVDMYSTYKII